MQTRRLLLFGRKWVSQNVALLWQSVATAAEKQREMKAAILTIVAAKQAGGDLDVIDKGEDLDENDSGVGMQVTWKAMLKNAKLKVWSRSTRNLSKWSKSMRSRSIF